MSNLTPFMGTGAWMCGAIVGRCHASQVTWHPKGHHNARPVSIGSRLGSAHSALCKTDKEGSLCLVLSVTSVPCVRQKESVLCSLVVHDSWFMSNSCHVTCYVTCWLFGQGPSAVQTHQRIHDRAGVEVQFEGVTKVQWAGGRKPAPPEADKAGGVLPWPAFCSNEGIAALTCVAVSFKDESISIIRIIRNQNQKLEADLQLIIYNHVMSDNHY